MAKRRAKKSSHGRLVNRHEAALVVLVLAVTLFFAYADDIDLTGRAISQSEGVPDWAMWAGAPWSFFDTDGISIGDTLVRASPDPVLIDSRGTASFNVTIKGDYVWYEGYLYHDGGWDKIEFSGNRHPMGWLIREGRAQLYKSLAPGTYWLVAYTCQYVNGQWKCGCRDADNCGRWQMQSVVVTSETISAEEASRIMDTYIREPEMRQQLRQQVRAKAVAVSEEIATEVKADFNKDGNINFDDFFLFADAFGTTDAKFDLDASGKVDFQDFFIFADNFGKKVEVTQNLILYNTFDKFNSIVVYGTYAQEQDYRYCLARFNEKGFENKADTKITTDDKVNKNLILIGTPFINRLVDDLDKAAKTASGEQWRTLEIPYIFHVIDTAFTTNRKALVIAGSDTENTRKACDAVFQAKKPNWPRTSTAVPVFTENTKIFLGDSLGKPGLKNVLNFRDFPVLLDMDKFKDSYSITEHIYTQTIELAPSDTSDNNYQLQFERPSMDSTKAETYSIGDWPTSPGLPPENGFMYRTIIEFVEPVNGTTAVGESIRLFGKRYVIDSGTDFTNGDSSTSNKLVIVGGAQTKILNVGDKFSLNVDGKDYGVTLISTPASTSALILVNSEQKTIPKGSTINVGGLDIFVEDVSKIKSSPTDKENTAKIILGAKKLTLQQYIQVRTGINEDTLQGTFVRLFISEGKLQRFDIYIGGVSSDNDYLALGGNYVDPVWKTFYLDFPSMASDNSANIYVVSKVG